MKTQNNNIMIQIDEQQLKRFIVLAVKTSFKDIKEEINDHERPVQLKELANFLGASPQSIRLKAENRELPYYRFKGKNSRYYFFKSQVLEVLKTGKVSTRREMGIDGADFYDVV
jgi:hypothetical protein